MTGATEGVIPDETQIDPAGLQACLRETFAGRPVRLVGRQRLKANVHRLQLDVDGDERSVVVKWSDPVVARRCGLVARRWLPAVGLEDHGPPLLAVAAEPTGERTWHVYEDLPGHPLSTERLVRGEVEAAVCAIARVHTVFAEHPLLPEFRLWGGDRGIHFYAANVRDAVVALHSLDLGRSDADATAARDALLQRMNDLKKQEPERAQAVAASAGPETLLHGDLWPSNVIIVPNGDTLRVRLIDLDEAAAGPIGFDLSTFLLRFNSSHRRWILDTYRQAVDRLAGWELPPEQDLNVIFETAAYARLLSLLVWNVAAAADGESDWLPARLVEMAEWLDAVSPVLPAR
jgi:Ser/Thr protein kinase RdoA (MazF antagonist)